MDAAGHPPWTDDERTQVANWLRLDFSCSFIGHKFDMSKKETVRRILADDQLRALRPQLKGINPQQRRHIPRTNVNQPPVRNYVMPLKPRRAAPVDPMMVQHKADLAHDLATDPPLPPMPVIPVSGMRLVALPDLGRGDCRWPVADDPDVVGKVRFCGKASLPGQSYCKAHRFAALPVRQREAAPQSKLRNRLLDKFGGVP